MLYNDSCDPECDNCLAVTTILTVIVGALNGISVNITGAGLICSVTVNVISLLVILTRESESMIMRILMLEL
jgi:hypothetical protein